MAAERNQTANRPLITAMRSPHTHTTHTTRTAPAALRGLHGTA
jgi:hypothetical protein